MKIELDMYQTLALAVLVLMLGKFLRERVRLLDKFCIPAPVIGGVLFAIFTCICYVTGVAEFAFDASWDSSVPSKRCARSCSSPRWAFRPTSRC